MVECGAENEKGIDKSAGLSTLPIVWLEDVPALGGELAEAVTEDCVVDGDPLGCGLLESIGERQTLIDGQGEVFLEVVGGRGDLHVGDENIRKWLKVNGYFKQSVSSIIFDTGRISMARKMKKSEKGLVFST